MRSYIVSEETKVLDLGSGDGRILFLAGALGANATGVEYDANLAEHSRTALSALSDKSIVDPDRINIIHGDFFDLDFSEYDVLFYYLDYNKPDQYGLWHKIQQELAPNARLLYGWEKAVFSGLELEGRWSDGLHGTKHLQPTISVYRQPKTVKRATDRR